MEKEKVSPIPYVVFVACGLIAACGAWLSRASRGGEAVLGLGVAVFFGLASIVLPFLLQKDLRKRRQDG